MRKGVGIEKKAYFCNGIEDAESDKVQVYTRDGRIVVDGADGEIVRVYDIMGRQQSSFTSHLSPSPRVSTWSKSATARHRK